jgi:hypothetical protein
MLKASLLLIAIAFLLIKSQAQCPAGTNQAQLNWEYLDFFPSAGHASYTNLAQSQTQRFVFGTQRVIMTHNFTGPNAFGEELVNTAKTGTYGSGMDLRFFGDGTITLAFQNPVQNLAFSIYDVDFSQVLTVSAFKGATPVNVGLTKLSGTALTITNNNTPVATATSSTGVADDVTGTDGTVNVNVTDSVTNIVIAFSATATKTTGPAAGRENGYTWLSKVFACSGGTFPSNYYNVSQPLPGQPGYVLTVRNNEVYYVDPSTGVAKLMFIDPGHTNINSMGYDGVNKMVYYTYSLSGGGGSTNPNNYTLRRYDYNMDTMGIVVSDVRTLGIPTFDVGVESGGAAFYNGSLYLGIESSNSGPYESIIWKIDFNGSFSPVSVAQQFAADGSTQDWADFGISNGILYNFDGLASAPDFHHINMLTHTVTNVPVASGVIPRQTGIDWTGVLYNIGPPGSTGTAGTIVPYNFAGGVTSANQRSITYNSVAVTGSWGDAAEAFKPKMDFGDAPASFDVPGGTEGVHEVTNNLRLGPAFNIEWNKRGASPLADMDLDDALSYTTILNNSGTYQTSVVVYNNTGGNATLAGWMDFNLDGVFSASEGVTVTVPTGAAPQAIDLFWTGIVSSIPNNSYTYLRLRLTSALNNLTTSNATGYMSDGEIEDYRVLVDAAPLSGRILTFKANRTEDKSVKLEWSVAEISTNNAFEIERSNDARDWTSIHKQQASVNSSVYYMVDEKAGKINFYRLKLIQQDGSFVYSVVRKVEISGSTDIRLLPNPASSYLQLSIHSDENTQGDLTIVDISGRIIHQEKLGLKQGLNHVNIPVIQQLPSGVYQADIVVNGKKITEKFVKSR